MTATTNTAAALKEGRGVIGELLDAMDRGEMTDEDCDAMDAFDAALDAVTAARTLLADTIIALYPERFPASEQLRVEAIADEKDAYGGDHYREWDRETVEWAAAAIVDAARLLGAAEASA